MRYLRGVFSNGDAEEWGRLITLLETFNPHLARARQQAHELETAKVKAKFLQTKTYRTVWSC